MSISYGHRLELFSQGDSECAAAFADGLMVYCRSGGRICWGRPRSHQAAELFLVLIIRIRTLSDTGRLWSIGLKL